MWKGGDLQYDNHSFAIRVGLWFSAFKTSAAVRCLAGLYGTRASSWTQRGAGDLVSIAQPSLDAHVVSAWLGIFSTPLIMRFACWGVRYEASVMSFQEHLMQLDSLDILTRRSANNTRHYSVELEPPVCYTNVFTPIQPSTWIIWMFFLFMVVQMTLVVQYFCHSDLWR